MRTDSAVDAPATGVTLLLADDDAGVRSLLGTLLRAAVGVGSVLEAEDGAEALAYARRRRIEVAVLDMNMPRLDGIGAARQLRALRPTLPIAIHSSDHELLRQRAAGLDLALFEKTDFEHLLAWVEQQAASPVASDHVPTAALDVCCELCGYGIVSRALPERCPMCGRDAVWAVPPGWGSRRAALHERRAG